MKKQKHLRTKQFFRSHDSFSNDKPIDFQINDFFDKLPDPENFVLVDIKHSMTVEPTSGDQNTVIESALVIYEDWS